MTIVRMRGLLSLVLSTANAGYAGYNGAFGIGIVDQKAVTVGLTAVKLPLTDLDWEGWLFHQFVSIHASEAFNTGGYGVSQQMEIDSRAMRKFDEDQELYAVLEVTETTEASLHAPTIQQRYQGTPKRCS